MIRIIDVTTTEQLNELYNDSALTIEGLAENSIKDFVVWVRDTAGLENETAYVIKGSVMNMNYGLSGSNAYPDELNIVAIKLSDIENVSKIILARFQFGGRWFDDIVDNNENRK